MSSKESSPSPPRKKKKGGGFGFLWFGRSKQDEKKDKNKKSNQEKTVGEELLTPSQELGMLTTSSKNRTLSKGDLQELTKQKRKENTVIESWSDILINSMKNVFKEPEKKKQESKEEKTKEEEHQEESKDANADVDETAQQPQPPKEKVTEILMSSSSSNLEETKENILSSGENLQSFTPLSEPPSRTLKRTLSKTQDHIIRITYSNFDDFTIPVRISEHPLHPSIPSISTAKVEKPDIVEIADSKFLVKTTPHIEGATERDPQNGVMTFKANAEYDLLLHVQNNMNNYHGVGNLPEDDRVSTILRSVDEYCTGKQWMFHVGRDKGEVLTSFLRECIKNYMERNNSKEGAAPSESRKPFRAVELGTYCGYSAILIAQGIKQYAPDLKFHLYSTETSPKYAQIANTMIQMAKLDDCITIILFDPSIKTLTKALKTHINDDEEPLIDYLFMDHAKDMYLSDLQELEDCALVRAGSHVAADNVVFSKLGAYRKYVAGLARRSVATTKLVDMNLEYSDVQDGIELTVYLKDIRDSEQVNFNIST
mmetsp:Transcript_5351/g.7573  ORF Transcript_5351/g.7573 Transcript_5351/m.7573 type:complete len:540 (+) Transcript_5351:440-2059(+)